MTKKLLFSFGTVAVASAFAASSYSVTLFDESVLDGKSLTPGQYKMQVNDDGVVRGMSKDVTKGACENRISRGQEISTSVLNDQHQMTDSIGRGTNKENRFRNTSTQKGRRSSSVNSVIK